MERAAEIKETTESSAEAAHLKSSEAEEASILTRRRDDDEDHGDEQAPDQQPDCSALDHPALAVSPPSREMLIEKLAGKGPNIDPESASEPGNAVEELTLSGYRGLELFGGKGSVVKKGLWSNLTRLSGDSVPPRRPMHMHSIPPAPPNYSKGKGCLAECQNLVVSRNAQGRTLDGVRNKVLPASGFRQLVVRNALKGKGVARALPGKGVSSRHHGTYKEPLTVIRNQNSGTRQEINMETGFYFVG